MRRARAWSCDPNGLSQIDAVTAHGGRLRPRRATKLGSTCRNIIWTCLEHQTPAKTPAIVRFPPPKNVLYGEFGALVRRSRGPWGPSRIPGLGYISGRPGCAKWVPVASPQPGARMAKKWQKSLIQVPYWENIKALHYLRPCFVMDCAVGSFHSGRSLLISSPACS